MSSSLAATPIQVQMPASVSHLAISLSEYLRTNPAFDRVAVGACIFNHHVSGESSPCLLLLQRASTERAFPNLWEVPGGSAEATDPTLLHSVAREVCEETGLKLTKVVRSVGTGLQFTTGDYKWNKLSFEIEYQNPDPLLVTLDPAEHQAYEWVTEERLRLWGPGKIVTEDQRQMMLLSFRQHKERNGNRP